jgi:hypothetical protein
MQASVTSAYQTKFHEIAVCQLEEKMHRHNCVLHIENVALTADLVD